MMFPIRHTTKDFAWHLVIFIVILVLFRLLIHKLNVIWLKLNLAEKIVNYLNHLIHSDSETLKRST